VAEPDVISSNINIQNDYGVHDEFKEGDVISVMIDMDQGTISYMKNLDFLGVAFDNVDTDKLWYPAISLARDQGCQVLFGGEFDPFK
jgi:hypothetical protein